MCKRLSCLQQLTNQFITKCRWTNSIDLTLTNAKGHDLMDRWQAARKDMDKNCSDHKFITYNISPKSGFDKTKFRDITKTDWKIYQDELTKHMTKTADVFNNLTTSTDIDKAASQLAANVRTAFNFACKENYVYNKERSPPWETPEVREAKAGIKHRLRQVRNTKSDKAGVSFARTRPSTTDFAVIQLKLSSRNFARLWKVNPRLKEFPVSLKIIKLPV